jgi:hypothetical protein
VPFCTLPALVAAAVLVGPAKAGVVAAGRLRKARLQEKEKKKMAQKEEEGQCEFEKAVNSGSGIY